MTTYNPKGRLLVTLFDQTQTGETTDLFSLSAGAGLNLYRTLAELHALAKRGLVDAGRLRLTLSGLAVAVSLNRRAQRAEAARGLPEGIVRLLPRATREQAESAEKQAIRRDLVA